MEQRVQYVRTTDEVDIAFWTLGVGRPLVYLAGAPWSHVELWQVAECRRWYERLAQRRMLIRYDMRGTGLSTRVVTDFSLDALLRDVETVTDELGLAQFALLGAADAGPVAVAYAARYPERVSHLILWCTWARTAAVRTSRIRAWLRLVDQDWDLMTETCAHIVFGWSGGDVGRVAAQHLRESVSQDAARAALDALGKFDVTALLSQVRARALVLHRRQISWLPVETARALAAALPDARLVVLDGETTAPYIGDTETAASAIDEFLGDGSATQEYPDGLTGREVEVLRLIAAGRTNKEIAEELVLSVRTVERHISNIYGKIGARGRADATAFALTRDLV